MQMVDRKKATPKKPRKAATRKKPVPRLITSPVRVAHQLNVTSPITVSGAGSSLVVHGDDQAAEATGVPPPTHAIFRDSPTPIGWGVGPLQAPLLKPDWAAHVPAILQAAQDLVSLYSQLDAILGHLKGRPSQPGDNTASERAEVIARFESDMRLAVWTREALQEQLQSVTPQPKVLEQNGHVFRVLANNAKRYADAFASGVLSGLGKYAGEQLPQLIPPLIDLLLRLPDLIQALFTKLL
jgi:hypothetical protein